MVVVNPIPHSLTEKNATRILTHPKDTNGSFMEIFSVHVLPTRPPSSTDNSIISPDMPKVNPKKLILLKTPKLIAFLDYSESPAVLNGRRVEKWEDLADSSTKIESADRLFRYTSPEVFIVQNSYYSRCPKKNF